MTDQAIAARKYAHPEALVSTDWLAQHLDDPSVRILESDEDVLLYDMGHIPGAHEDRLAHRPATTRSMRDYIVARAVPGAAAPARHRRSTTVVFYGDKNNWWATYAFWVFQLFGFTQREAPRRRPGEVGGRKDGR